MNRSAPFFHAFLFLLVLIAINRKNISIAQQTALSYQKIQKLANENIEKHRKGDIVIKLMDEVGEPLTGYEINTFQESHAFHFGAIIFELVRDGKISPEQEPLFKKRFAHLFNYAVFPFYWAGYETTPGSPQWQKTNEVIQWCMSKSITCKGHPLAWTHTAGTPSWIYKLPPEEATHMLKSRIIENTLGYKHAIDIWDVVNEPVNTITWDEALHDTEFTNDNRYGHDAAIQEIADWVDPCFQWAYMGNPDATLILNEFGQIAFPETRQRFYELLKELARRGTPVSGIGIQAHEPRQDWYDPVEVWNTLELYSEFDIPLHITEFIPQSSSMPIQGGYKTGTWNPKKQAEYAELMYTIAFGHPSVVSMNWWGVSENDIWLEGGGLLEKDLSPKPVYHALDRLINSEWKTNYLAKTNQNGELITRGFYGDYKVTVTDTLGKKHSYMFEHQKTKKSNWEIIVY